MLIYKQRYKPRTTREFTKSDMTVYDSADNTVLNALTVYGKSEVVDGAIVSAGEHGSIEIETSKKNLFNSSIYSEYLQQDGTYKCNPGVLNGIKISLKSYIGKVLTFSAYLSRSGSYPTNMRVSATINGVVRSGTAVNTETYTRSTLTITPETENDEIYISYGSSGGAEYMYFKDVQLEFGTSATTYEPYNGTMATFTTGTPLRGITGGARDVMAWDGSAGTVTKNCAKVRLADLTWQLNPQYPGGFQSDITASLAGMCGLLCDKYPYDENVNFKWANFNSLENKTIYRATNLTNIFIKDTDYTTVSDFVASLGDAELVYELATPTTASFTATENASFAGLETYSPQTHAQNNAQAEMTLDYTIRVPTI